MSFSWSLINVQLVTKGNKLNSLIPFTSMINRTYQKYVSDSYTLKEANKKENQPFRYIAAIPAFRPMRMTGMAFFPSQSNPPRAVRPFHG